MSSSVAPVSLPAPVATAPHADSPSATVSLATTDADADSPDNAGASAHLQIGDFVLGDMDCPSLTGHPDIRY